MARNLYMYSDKPEPMMKYINDSVNNIEYTPFKDLVAKYGENAKFYVEIDSDYYDTTKIFYIMDELLETQKEVVELLLLAKKERYNAKKEAAVKRKQTIENKKKKEDEEYFTYLKLKEKFGDT
jgi:hypothetical protein